MKTCVVSFAFLCFVLSVNAVPQQVNIDLEKELATTAAANIEKSTSNTPPRKRIIFDCTPYCRYNVLTRSRDRCPFDRRRQLLCKICRYVLKCTPISSKMGP
ncbi:uncharacterized protein LOC143465382 [Clavelina lepadiformis]|uniref:Uncharacterized protein n=1 Tax=Clavelina lepadiformis TaxID=159417 RepID=A0ABP0F0H0_CLALP